MKKHQIAVFTWPNSTFEFWIFWIFWSVWIFWTSLVSSCHRSPCAYERLSFCHPWELDAASGLEFWLVLASGLPDNPTCRLEALSIRGLLDAIGLFTDKNLSNQWRPGSSLLAWISPQSCFSSFSSCILFAIVLVQLVNLEFLAQQVELKWLMLNKQRRLFHSSRVKFPSVKMSAIWCFVSMFLIWILGSKLILSNNQSRETLWVLDTCLVVGLLLLIIILITASLSSKHVQHRNGLRKSD